MRGLPLAGLRIFFEGYFCYTGCSAAHGLSLSPVAKPLGTGATISRRSTQGKTQR